MGLGASGPDTAATAGATPGSSTVGATYQLFGTLAVTAAGEAAALVVAAPLADPPIAAELVNGLAGAGGAAVEVVVAIFRPVTSIFCRAGAGVCVRTPATLTLVARRAGAAAYASESFSPKEFDESCCALSCAQRIGLEPAKNLSPVCRIVKSHQPPTRLEHGRCQMRSICREPG